MTDSKHPSPPSENRIEVVDCLRGIAVLSVCISHFMAANCGLAADSFIRQVGTHGWLGVEIFFVISGFIIPYSLHRSGYKLSDYPKFLLKRVLRLDPPYLLAVLLAIVVGWLAAQSSAYRGAPYQVSIPQVLLHLAYVNTFFGYDWVNAVFWTLAIEFQYYLAVGLLLPLIAHHSLAVRVALGCGLGALAVLLPEGRFIFHWLFLFMLGMLAFHWHAKLAGRRELGFGLALLGGGVVHAGTAASLRWGGHRVGYRVGPAQGPAAGVPGDDLLFAVSDSRSDRREARESGWSVCDWDAYELGINRGRAWSFHTLRVGALLLCRAPSAAVVLQGEVSGQPFSRLIRWPSSSQFRQ